MRDKTAWGIRFGFHLFANLTTGPHSDKAASQDLADLRRR
jgi:hypothetical protein